jgi:hypothetical protein
MTVMLWLDWCHDDDDDDDDEDHHLALTSAEQHAAQEAQQCTATGSKVVHMVVVK